MKEILFHTDKNLLVLLRTEVSTCQKNWLFLVQTLTHLQVVGTWILWSLSKALWVRHDLNSALVNFNLHLPPSRFSDKTLTMADMIRPQHHKWQLNIHGYLNFRWYMLVWILQTVMLASSATERRLSSPKSLPRLLKKCHLWFTASFSAPSARVQVPIPRHV